MVIQKRSGLVSILSGFSQETGAHAIPRVGDAGRKPVPRIIWAILFLVATVFCIYQITLLVTEYLEYPTNVETTLEYRPLQFPAVTVCNANPFLQYEDIVSEARERDDTDSMVSKFLGILKMSYLTFRVDCCLFLQNDGSDAHLMASICRHRHF